MNIEPWRDRANRLARSIGEAASRWGPGTTQPATGILLALMIVGGVVLRIQNVGYPFRYGFDESQWVGAARQFLVRLPDAGECCHPPLAKLLIGVGMLVFGDTPLGWRFMPLCLGIQSIVLVFFIASALFKDRRAGWFAAAFMAGDGFFLAFSRNAFSEGMMATLVLWSLLAAITARGWGGVLASALLVGLAASIKWSGVVVALPACFAILLLRRAPWYSVVSFAIVPLVHLAIWMIGLSLIGQPNDPMSVLSEMRRRQGLHLGFPHGSNPAESPWYTWLLIQHPLVLNSTYSGSTARLTSSVGNPLLLIAWDLCLLAMPVAAAAYALRVRRLTEWWSRVFDADANRAQLILGVAFASMMMLWISGRIVSYWYHYLTPWGLAITLLAGVVSRLDRRYPKGVLIFVAAVLAVAIYFAPVWAELPISIPAAHRRLIFSRWR